MRAVGCPGFMRLKTPATLRRLVNDLHQLARGHRDRRPIAVDGTWNEPSTLLGPTAIDIINTRPWRKGPWREPSQPLRKREDELYPIILRIEPLCFQTLHRNVEPDVSLLDSNGQEPTSYCDWN